MGVFIGGTLVSLILDFWTILIGRFISAIALGIFLIVCSKFISEVTPYALINITGSYPILIGHLGCFLSILLGYLYIPYSGDEGEMGSRGWQVVFAAPLVFSSVSFGMILFYFKYDTPQYYTDMKMVEEIERYKKEVYLKDDETILKFSSLKEVVISVNHSWGAIFSPKYLFMTFYGCIVYLFFNLNGANALVFYST